MSEQKIETVKVLSLGAGVQSSSLLLAYLKGVLDDPPQFAVFADTQAEPKDVYDWLERLDKISDGKIPIIRVTKGSLTHDYLHGKHYANIPFFIDNKDGLMGMAPRHCTRDYKISQIEKAIRKELGYARGQRVKNHKVQTQIGISTDEATRMKPSKVSWIQNQYPLIEILEWSRADCIDFVKSLGLPSPPKSACYVCPYRNNEEWKQMKRNDPEAFQAAVDFEKKVQVTTASLEQKKRQLKGIPYLHRSLKPLDKIDFSALAPDYKYNLFENECEGMCGV